MHDRALHIDTDRRPCPGCGTLLHPADRYCWRCEAYLQDLAAQPDIEPDIEPTKRDHSDPVLVVWPWDVLANVNDRVAPVGEEGKRKARRYKRRRDAMAAIVAQVAQGREPFTGPVRVTFDFWTPDEREDPQNKEKAALDALQGPPGIPGVYLNDRQARHRVSIDHGTVPERARMEARVEAIHMDETEGR